MRIAGPVTLASRNPGKLAELAALCGGLIEIRSLPLEPRPPEVVEDQATYLGNARKKALAIARFVGGPALGDDSGLEVDALGGGPGVASARYGGAGATDRERCERLLRELDRVTERTARFRCVLVLGSGDEWLSAEGVLEGSIALAPHGEGGFGYDPIFAVPQAGGRTLAELSAAEKNRISHRAAAMRELVAALGLAGR